MNSKCNYEVQSTAEIISFLVQNLEENTHLWVTCFLKNIAFHGAHKHLPFFYKADSNQ